MSQMKEVTSALLRADLFSGQRLSTLMNHLVGGEGKNFGTDFFLCSQLYCNKPWQLSKQRADRFCSSFASHSVMFELQGAVVGALLRPIRMIRPKTKGIKFNEDYNSTMSVFGRLRKYSFSNHGESQYSLFAEDEPIQPPHVHEKLIEEDKKFEKLEPYCMAKRLIEHNYESHATTFRSDCTLDAIPEMAPLKLPIPSGEKAAMDEELSGEPSSEDLPVIEMYSECKRPAVCHWRVMALIVMNCTWGFGASIAYVFLPTYANSFGISQTKVSHMFLVIGIIGFFGRVSAVLICKYTK